MLLAVVITTRRCVVERQPREAEVPLSVDQSINYPIAVVFPWYFIGTIVAGSRRKKPIMHMLDNVFHFLLFFLNFTFYLGNSFRPHNPGVLDSACGAVYWS